MPVTSTAHDTAIARSRTSPIASRIAASSLTTLLDHRVEPVLVDQAHPVVPLADVDARPSTGDWLFICSSFSKGHELSHVARRNSPPTDP